MFASSKSGAVADPKDSKFNYVTMLLHGNGTNGAQNNTFVDSSTNNFSITRNGNTTQGTFSPYGANWSNYFDGSGDYLSVSSNAAFGYGTGDFTIEFWVFPTSATGTQVYLDQRAGTSTSAVPTIYTSSGTIYYYVSGSNRITGGSLSLNQWSHIAICRSGTSTKLFINGTQSGSTFTDTTTYITSPVRIADGNDGAGPYPYPGYISNFRIIKGNALYTTTFTPPTSPLTAITNTSLLTCADNRFIDDSTNNFTITRNGDVSVQRFSPFSPTSAYTTSVIGGSGYFDGSGDYLTVPDSSAIAFGSGDLTIECWCYSFATTGGADQIILGKYTGSFGSSSFSMGQNNTTLTMAFYTGGSSYFLMTSSVALQGRVWNHIAVTRSGNSWYMFLNGVQVANTTQNVTVISNTTPLYVGGEPYYNQMFTGYISNLRIVKGTAVYTSAFTPPSAPLTAITNTSVLLSYTNAGILDNAMMNDLETVGNAQISTSVKKFGTGSISFDGTGDYLYGPTSPNTSFGTGDFTIEFWMYSNNVSGASQLGMLQMSDSAGGLKASYLTQLCINQGQTASGSALNGAIVANINNTNVGSTTAVLTTGTWYHIALVRSSGTVNLYVNGTSVGSATITSAINGPYIVVGGYYSSSFLFNGYLDDVRITKGFARYTSNFTAPTAAFPDKG
jgi:hypothetical protein